MIDWISIKNSLFKIFCIYILGPILKGRRAGTISQRVLFIESAGLGDMCVLLPFVRRLADSKYKVDVCCPEGVADLWHQHLPTDSRIITFNNRTLWSVHGVYKICNDFGRTQYEAVFGIAQMSIVSFISVCARSTLRIGMIQGDFFYKGSRLLFDQLYSAKIDEHMTNRFERQFALFTGVSPKTNRFIAPSIPSEMGKFILLHPGSKWFPKRWPVEKFKSLAMKFRENGIPVTIAAHTSEPDIISFFSDFSDGKDQRFVTTPSISSLMELTAQCSVYVGNDSGPTHLANLYAKPMIVLWGPALTERISPLGNNVTILKKEVPCRPCHQKVGALACSNGENICLTRISIDEVYDTVLPLWENL